MSEIFVGLSGGVDSAVSAALLKEQGNSVTGVFIKIWQPEFIECTWRTDRLDAMRVAVALGIRFEEVDLSHEYERDVVRGMIADYQSGITPNPDVLCNNKIKFGAFKDWAFERGADHIATGHYAQHLVDQGRHALLRGIDPGKDQSYFLYRIERSDLARVQFPIGGLTKQAVRSYARERGLPVADKHDSQGLCFVGDVSMRDFLARYIPMQSGAVLDAAGKIIGEHDGAALYTIGQRHGFRLAAPATPMYVTAVNAKENTITVSENKSDAARITVQLSDPHWMQPPEPNEVLYAQARYHEQPFEVTLSRQGEASPWIIEFQKPHIVAPGQSLVLYRDQECIGGGVIAAGS